MSNALEVTRDEIASMARRFAQSAFPTCDCAMYGSTAEGLRHSESDVDILILVDEDVAAHRVRRFVGGFSFDICVVGYPSLTGIVEKTRSRHNFFFEKIAASGLFLVGSVRRLNESLAMAPPFVFPLSNLQLRSALASLHSDLLNITGSSKKALALIMETYRMLTAEIAFRCRSECGPLPVLVAGLPDDQDMYLDEVESAVREAIVGKTSPLLAMASRCLERLGGAPLPGESYPLF